ncbi:MAG: hypothetical protein ACEY3G_02325 [Arsenophonus sp.]
MIPELVNKNNTGLLGWRVCIMGVLANLLLEQCGLVVGMMPNLLVEREISHASPD